MPLTMIRVIKEKPIIMIERVRAMVSIVNPCDSGVVISVFYYLLSTLSIGFLEKILNRYQIRVYEKRGRGLAA